MEGDDLIVGECQGVILKTDSLEAKANLMKIVNSMTGKHSEIKSNGSTCGDCVAYPCFRNRDKDSSAKLCFQEYRRCREECNDFIINRGSGIAPHFQITGTCEKNNATVNYEERCRYLD